ncbi:MAG TPA: thiamine-phosphate kinase [Solirubrobacterales bacterium]|nr:thiamine-phosphate kinase [Solirubrobacterales bacterium]
MPDSEFDLIAAINERLPAPGPRVRVPSGDDAAIVEPRAASAVTVDAIVDGVHFMLDSYGPEAVGRKALAASLSDLAAMGASQGEAYVVVAAPGDLSDDDLLGIADGLAEVATREEVTIAGGDLVRSPVLVVSVTSVGYEPGGARFVTRRGARPRDLVAVTGELGGAAAAVRLMEVGERRGDPADRGQSILNRQLDPRPRLREGRALAKSGVTAMIDVSDGLGADATHLADAGECHLEIDLGRLPVAPGVADVVGGGEAAIELAASGGEDFELLVTVPREHLDAATQAVADAGSQLTEIGYVSEGQGVTLRLPGGGELEARGFDQRRGSLSGSG